MNKTFNFMLALTMCVAAVVTTSCKRNDPEVPTQQEIETKIIGKWKQIAIDGKDIVTNVRVLKAFNANHSGIYSTSRSFEGEYLWLNKTPFNYEISGNELCESSEGGTRKVKSRITSIDETKLCENDYQFLVDGKYVTYNTSTTYQKVTADYSQDIIGMWEGVEMTGDETYGDANHRIEYKADGTYTYYDKVEENWEPRKDDISEYNVDGDWLATRWQHTAGDVTNYEWWDIVEIKDGTMKWSALREKEDKTRFTTTFTWKKVNLPTQEEIETKIIGKWKEIVTEGKDALTNSRTIRTFYTGNKATHSCSRIYDGNYAWYNKSPFKYEVSGCDMCESSEENSFKTFSKVMSIDESKLSANYYKEILPEGQERGININAIYQKVSADYSEAIIGLWEGVEMTGDETYGDANHRIEYKADGTYTYYDKVEENWEPRKDDISEYNVDGDWLATRWQHTAGDVTNYEWWDIVEIKDGTMKWSALREKEDKTRYTTTFTWKKVN